MKTGIALFAPLLIFAAPVLAQGPTVITMDQEPHHHLTLQNEYVKVFKVEVTPGDSIILHKHDQDTVAIAIGDQLVTAGIPGKPDVHQKNADAQVRLQRSGYMHSTHVDGDTPYHTVAVELLRPQSNFHNRCAGVLVGEPVELDCIFSGGAGFVRRPLLDSDQTNVSAVTVHPHQAMPPADFPFASVIVALDPATVPSTNTKRPDRKMQPGDFLWIEGRHGPTYRNDGDKDARFVEILFPPAK